VIHDGDVQQALVRCYSCLSFYIEEFIEDPSGSRARARMEYQDRWLSNLINKRSNSMGEFVP
jgi:hypothetical protein